MSAHPLGATASPVTPVHWRCAKPHCPSWATTVDGRIPHHRCGELAGLTVPLVRVDERAALVVRERDDYIGDELVQYGPDGRPVMAVETHRDDGVSVTVFAPTATASTEEKEAARHGR